MPSTELLLRPLPADLLRGAGLHANGTLQLLWLGLGLGLDLLRGAGLHANGSAPSP